MNGPPFLACPETASDSGFTDFVLSPKRIAEELASIARNPQGVFTMNELAGANESVLRKIQVLLHSKKGVDFGYYKQTTVNRRILRRMVLDKLSDLSEYARLLREDSH